MSLLTELKRRNVFRVAAAYAIVGWILVQASDIVFPRLGLPEWTVTFVILLVVLGFPLALFLAWAYELTPEGVKRADEVAHEASIRPQSGRRLDWLILAGFVIVVAVVAVDRVWISRAPVPAAVESILNGEADPVEAHDITDRSIAVLPFADMSAEGDQEYFADGLSEEILNLLAQIKPLKVIGRTSSFAFKGRGEDLRNIGAILGVSYLLEGSVRKAGDQVRITAQLIQAWDGSHLWSQSYDRRLDNIFEIQTEIAQAITGALQLELADADVATLTVQHTASIPAYELYMQARRLIQGRTRSGLIAARDLLDEALALDPEYPPALASSGLLWLLMAETAGTYGDVPLDRAVIEAQKMLDRALAADPRLAEAHAAQGLLFRMVRDFDRSEAALLRALELNPSLSDALFWQVSNVINTGRLREAVAASRSLAEFDPLYLVNLSSLAVLHLRSGELEEAEAAAVRLQRAFPDHPSGFLRQAEVFSLSGRLAEAQPLAHRALALSPNDTFVQRSVSRVFLTLGDYASILSLPMSHLHGTALAGLGQTEAGIAEARGRAAASPGDSDTTSDLLDVLSLAGRHQALLELYQQRWDGLSMMEAFFVDATGFINALGRLAAAQRADGRHLELVESLKPWREKLEFMREHGYDYSRFTWFIASYEAVSGDRDAALATLAGAIEQGYRDPLLAQRAEFAPWHDDPEFQILLVRMNNLINAERAMLGMGPL